MIENTHRTGEFNDPLDQGHIEKESSTFEARQEKSVGQIHAEPPLDIGSGSLNGNIYNVTNTINVHVAPDNT
jgi:hypothetical protein